MLIILAIISGLIINYFTGGLNFSSLLCAFAGLFLMMPSLLKLKFQDFKNIFSYKKLIFTSLFLNFIVIPFIFFFFSYLFLDDIYYLKYAFLLLGLMSSGGLVMSWVMKNKGDTKIAFILFMINFLFFIFLFFPINSFFQKEALSSLSLINSIKVGGDGATGAGGVVCVFQNYLPKCLSSLGSNASPIIAFFSIILIPFIVSRFILLSNKLENIISSKIKIISSISTFFIVSYIFSLKQINEVLSINYELLIKIFFVLILVYTITYLISFFMYKIFFNNKEGIALFWVSSTRYLTLGLIFSFIYSATFGYSFLLVFILAYFVQIITSLIFSTIINKYNK